MGWLQVAQDLLTALANFGDAVKPSLVRIGEFVLFLVGLFTMLRMVLRVHKLPYKQGIVLHPTQRRARKRRSGADVHRDKGKNVGSFSSRKL